MWGVSMKSKSLFMILAAVIILRSDAVAATVGQVVPIGGQSADLALDEARGVLYVANFTANRVEVMSLTDLSIQTSITVAAQPSSLALSSDGRYLVITHFSNFAAPASSSNGLTVIDLTTSGRQTFALGNPPLGIAFGLDNLALVVTTQEYILFDPVSGSTQTLGTIASVTAKTLPVPPANFPGDITNASMAVSADGLTVYGLGSSTGTFTFKYDVLSKQVGPGGIVLSSGVLGPRIVSLNQDASKIMAGWTMIDRQGAFINYFKQKSNQFSIGTTAFDNGRNLLYAQIPAVVGEAPVLQVTDPDNLNVLDRLQLPENFTGKSIISSDGSRLYGTSDSGVLIIPIGSLTRVARLVASVEDVVFRGNACGSNVTPQQFTISDPGNNRVSFKIVAPAGVSVSPTSGVTPAVINVTVDPSIFGSQKGTTAVNLTIQSDQAVNIPPTVRILVNQKDPDQRGTFIDIPGTLSDLLADPGRNRYYVLRQDKNQLLVFDGSNNSQIASLKTYNSPTGMATTYDGRYLLIGHNSSQAVAVYDLDTLQAQPYINVEAGGGNEAHSIAVSAKAILAAAVDYQGKGHIIQIDLASRRATQLPSLGIFTNDNVNPTTVAVGSANGSSIMFASIDGTTMLYDANAGTFAAARKDFKSLNGAYAASNFGLYVVGSNVLNSSLVPVSSLQTASGNTASGFVFVDQTGFRTTTSGSSNPGIIQRVDLTKGSVSLIRATRMVESPITLATGFTRTLALLYSRTSIINLTTSGLTVLPWEYDASVAPPQLTRIVNAADQSKNVAPGSLVTVYGTNLSPVNVATNQIPLPTALADSCLSVNGLAVPIILVSPTQINAQLPYQATGNVTMILKTPGGISDNFNFTIQPQAPGVFYTPVDGLADSVPYLIRSANMTVVTDSNPIHKGDDITIFIGGLGQTIPIVDAGSPAPSDPIAVPLVSPTVTLGSSNLAVRAVGLVPGQIGVFQIDVSVPNNVSPGLNIPLQIKQGTGSTTLGVRVVD